MTHLIDREALKAFLKERFEAAGKPGNDAWYAGWERMYESAVFSIDAAPTVYCERCETEHWFKTLPRRARLQCDHCYCGSNFKEAQP